MNKTLLVALAAWCAMGVTATGCGNESVAITPTTTVSAPESVITASSVHDTTVNLSATAETQYGLVTVTGEATVPDGARIDWEVGDSFQNDW